jgi:hypothetical protein
MGSGLPGGEGGPLEDGGPHGQAASRGDPSGGSGRVAAGQAGGRPAALANGPRGAGTGR